MGLILHHLGLSGPDILKIFILVEVVNSHLLDEGFDNRFKEHVKREV
jgi:hypothetical protein